MCVDLLRLGDRATDFFFSAFIIGSAINTTNNIGDFAITPSVAAITNCRLLRNIKDRHSWGAYFYCIAIVNRLFLRNNAESCFVVTSTRVNWNNQNTITATPGEIKPLKNQSSQRACKFSAAINYPSKTSLWPFPGPKFDNRRLSEK